MDGALGGNLEMPFPEYSHEESRAAAVYIRPHELEVTRVPNGSSSLRSRVLHVNPAGPVARVLLRSTDLGQEINVDLSPGRLAELGLRVGEAVFVSPRRARVFLPQEPGALDYAI